MRRLTWGAGAMPHPAKPVLRVNRMVPVGGLTINIGAPFEFETPEDASNLFGLAWTGRITVANAAARLALTKAGKINGTLVQQTTPSNVFVLVDVDLLETGSAADAFQPLLEVAGTSWGSGALTKIVPSAAA